MHPPKKETGPVISKQANQTSPVPLDEKMILQLKRPGKKYKRGIFGADMKVELLNDGPVTIMMDSKNRE